MKKQYIYKTLGNELVYVNNKGDEFLLTEAISLIGKNSYDLIVAIKLNPKYAEDPDNEFYYDTEADAVWFSGADFIMDYLRGADNGSIVIENCKMFLDDKTAEQKIGRPEPFYTGGGIWICAMWIDETHYIAIDNDWYADGFVIYDRSKEDDDPEIEFPCMEIEGEKLMADFTEEDKENYKKMKEALDEAIRKDIGEF